MTLQQIKVRLVLREATEALIMAYWSDQPQHHLERAQSALIAALCGGEGNRDDLVDLIESAGVEPEDIANALIQSATPKGE